MHHPTNQKHGGDTSSRQVYSSGTQTFPMTSVSDLTPASHPSFKLSPHQIGHPLPSTRPNLIFLYKPSSKRSDISAPSLEKKQSRFWAPFKPPHSASYRSPGGQASSGSSRTCLPPIPRCAPSPLSTAPLTRASTPAHGVLSPPSASSYGASHQARKQRYVTSKKLIEEFPSNPTNGLGWLSAYTKTTASQSTQGTALGWPPVVASTVSWEMQEPRSCVHVALAPSQNGSMTTFSSESCAPTLRATISSGNNGPLTWWRMAAKFTMVAASGSEAQLCQTTNQRNSMRICPSPSVIYHLLPKGSFYLPAPALSPLPLRPLLTLFADPKKTASSHTPWQTSTPCPTFWASPGKPARISPSATSPLSSASLGISPTAQSVYPRTRGRNIFKPFRSRSRSRNMSWVKYRSYMGSYFMPATSFLLEEPTSPTWRPSWGYATIALSARVPHPAELRAIFSGGRISSPSQPSSDPSPAPPLLSIQTLTQMLAQRLASGSRLGTGGEHGDFYQAGKPIARTLDGQRQSAFSSSSSPLPPLHQEAPTSRSSVTTEEWSMMNMCLFYQRESGFPKLSTVTRIDLHFRTTSASLQLPSLQSTFGRLSHHSAHSPFASKYPGHVSTEYPKTLSRVRASRIISPSNVQHRLYTCCNTSVESSQTYQHISHNISETPRAPPCISEYYSFLKHHYSGYPTLFVHRTQTVMGSSRTFAHSPFDFLSTPDEWYLPLIS
jgi:hypothetical protein